MSYLLKALEKAQQERDACVADVKQDDLPVVKHAQLPKSVLLIVLMILLAVLYSVFADALKTPELKHEEASGDKVKLDGLKQDSAVRKVGGAMIVDKGVQGNVKEAVNSSLSTPLQLFELDSAVLKVLPSIQFQSHIYSSASEYRSVMLNDRSLREGMPVSAEVRLQEITPTGIILEVNGVQVQLPKGQDWIAAQ